MQGWTVPVLAWGICVGSKESDHQPGPGPGGSQVEPYVPDVFIATLFADYSYQKAEGELFHGEFGAERL